MAELDENLDLLDLEDDADLDSFPESNPFENPRPKKPWLLLGLGVLVIVLATYIIIRSVGSDSDSSVEINLDTPVVVDGSAEEQNPVTAPLVIPEEKQTVEENDKSGIPVRKIEDRKPVEFKPAAVAPKPAPVVEKVAVAKPAPVVEKKSIYTNPPKQVTATKAGSWYVQFGSYSTRELAQRAQNKIRDGHTGLFAGKQFVILAAVLPNGKTTYRLRIAFEKSSEANGFCQNAKSDGLECYVAR